MAVNFMDMQKAVPRDQTTLSMSVPPDVGIFCSKCREFIQVLRIRDHRAVHKALTIFGYKKVSQVKSLDQLSVKRVELQQSIAHEHRDSITLQEQQANQPPVLRAPGRPRPPNALDTLVAAKREYLLVDEAYQIIRDYCFFDKSPFILKPKSDVRHCIGMPSLSPGICAVGVAADQNEAYRPTMEDFRLLADPFGSASVGACLFGLLDGYNGVRAAKFACKSIPHLLIEELSRIDPCFTENCLAENEDCWGKEMAAKTEILRLARNLTSDVMSSALQKAQQHIGADTTTPNKEDASMSAEEIKTIGIRRALAKCLMKADRQLATVGDELSLVRWSGCSATIGMILPKNYLNPNDNNSYQDGNSDMMLFMSNCGNSHAIIIEGGRAKMLTEDHSVENPNEVKRVMDKGGKVIGTGTKKLVCGLLATTRGIGNYGQPELRKSVSCSPCTCFRQLGSDAQMVIVGTPGLWSVLSKNEVATIAMQTVTYCCAKLNSRQLLDSAPTSLLQYDTTIISIKIDSHEETGDNDKNAEEIAKDTALGLETVAESVPAEAEDRDSYDESLEKKPNEEQAEFVENPVKSDEEKVEEKREETMEEETPSSAENVAETAVPPEEEKGKTLWWARNLTANLPSESGEPFPGSMVPQTLGEPKEEPPEETKPPVSVMDTRRVKKEEPQPPTTMSSMFSQTHVDVARTVALNLASAALLAGSQDNITVQVLLLPNYRSLAEIHNRPVIAPLPNVPTALQF